MEFHPPPSELPLVSVIVACMGQLGYTKGLAASLERNAGCRYELIVVDNGCPEGTAKWAAAAGHQVVRFNTNQGVPVAYNAGVQRAKGGLLAFFNNDMTVDAGGLRRLAEASGRRGIAAQTANAWSPLGDYLGCTADARWSDAAEGYALVCQREVWEKVGVWNDEFFPSYCDDTEWVLRARLKGFDYTLVPACVKHFGQATSQSMDLKPAVRRHQEIIRQRYVPHGLG
ncbi:MAG TPA: glycosyltransferase, partial [Armatimonadota bacterium]|nr:glycosyltransferase [Armatimonadota bacterium]